MLEREKYKISNSRIWYLCSKELNQGEKVTQDNWTRYASKYKEIFYLNDKEKFLEVNHYTKEFWFIGNKIIKKNADDFTRFFKNKLKYKLIIKGGFASEKVTAKK